MRFNSKAKLDTSQVTDRRVRRGELAYRGKKWNWKTQRFEPDPTFGTRQKTTLDVEIERGEVSASGMNRLKPEGKPEYRHTKVSKKGPTLAGTGPGIRAARKPRVMRPKPKRVPGRKKLLRRRVLGAGD